MSSLRYYNQLAPFWDFISDLEERGPWSGRRGGPNRAANRGPVNEGNVNDPNAWTEGMAGFPFGPMPHRQRHGHGGPGRRHGRHQQHGEAAPAPEATGAMTPDSEKEAETETEKVPIIEQVQSDAEKPRRGPGAGRGGRGGRGRGMGRGRFAGAAARGLNNDQTEAPVSSDEKIGAPMRSGPRAFRQHVIAIHGPLRASPDAGTESEGSQKPAPKAPRARERLQQEFGIGPRRVERFHRELGVGPRKLLRLRREFEADRQAGPVAPKSGPCGPAGRGGRGMGACRGRGAGQVRGRGGPAALARGFGEESTSGPHFGPAAGPRGGPGGRGRGHGLHRGMRRGPGGPGMRQFGPFAGMPGGQRANNDGKFRPKVDVFDHAEAFVIYASLPGAKKEDIEVNWDSEKSELSIAGHIHRSGDEEMLKTIAMSERKVGAFERKVRLGSPTKVAQVEVDDINAKMEDGVLKIEVRKQLDNGFVEVKKVDIK